MRSCWSLRAECTPTAPRSRAAGSPRGLPGRATRRSSPGSARSRFGEALLEPSSRHVRAARRGACSRAISRCTYLSHITGHGLLKLMRPSKPQRPTASSASAARAAGARASSPSEAGMDARSRPPTRHFQHGRRGFCRLLQRSRRGRRGRREIADSAWATARCSSGERSRRGRERVSPRAGRSAVRRRAGLEALSLTCQVVTLRG